MRKTENLNGIWDFAYIGAEKPVLPVATNEFMPVPGCFDLMEPHCGKRGYAVLTRKVFTGGMVELFIDGAGLDCEVYFDDKKIGFMKFAYMPENFIFDAGEEKEHTLTLILNNQYNAQFAPYNDFFGYGGVYGDVTITRLDPTHITAIRIATEDYKTGKIRLWGEASRNYTGKTKIAFDTGYTLDGDFADGKLEMEITLPEYKLWNADTPNLHTVTLTLPEGDEKTETFGIRSVWTEGRNILVNGRRVKLYGVNRHESHPTFGAAMPAQLIAYDLKLLKEAGFNFIRGSHYPQRKVFLDLCNKMGFFVWEETLGWDVKAPKLHSEEFLKDQLEEAEKLTYKSFSYPCIIIRGYLNENESEKEETKPLIKALYDKIRSIDKYTLISYSSNRYEKDVCTDIPDVIAMNPYPGWYDACYEEISGIHNVKRVLHELSEKMPKDKPYLITEIGGEALLGFRDPIKARWTEDYQAELLMECTSYALGEDECAGLSIWHFADTRSYITGDGIYGRARGYNNKGILDEFRRPKLSWTFLRKMVKEKYSCLIEKEK